VCVPILSLMPTDRAALFRILYACCLFIGLSDPLRLGKRGVSSTVQNISIHNNDALLAEKQGLVSIVWKEEFLFSLIGEVDKAEMIKMAESISQK